MRGWLGKLRGRGGWLRILHIRHSGGRMRYQRGRKQYGCHGKNKRTARECESLQVFLRGAGERTCKSERRTGGVEIFHTVKICDIARFEINLKLECTRDALISANDF